MSAKRAEQTKKPGVSYAFTEDGIELPVIDITHPAFSLDVSDEEQRGLVERYMNEPQPLARLPSFLRNAILGFLLRKSPLGSAIRRANGTFMSGLDTYLLKLGPDNLGEAWASPVDRRIAASLPVLAMRLRLQDVARLVAEAFRPALSADPTSAIRIIDIAGGPSIDAINALLLLRASGELGARSVHIDVLDLDEAGPAFGERALGALREPGAALEGVDVSIHRTSYDWNDTTALAATLQAHDDLTVCVSEGGLFEYGNDETITANLRCLHDHGRDDLTVVGSVTRNDAFIERLRATSRPATHPRGLDVFRALARAAGWNVTRAIARPLSDQVSLTKLR